MDKTMTKRIYSNAKIKRDLGFQPKFSMLDGIVRTIEYELEHGGLEERRISPLVSALATFASLLVFGVTRVYLHRQATDTLP
jgi:hypothetical protein